MEQKLFIKNMVCDRCVKAIESDFETLGIHLKHIELGCIIYEEKSKDDFDRAKDQIIKCFILSDGKVSPLQSIYETIN